MTSTVKVNNVQASDGGNIINQCGTNITIGASGDTIALASGASQTGFGRTGTVDWQTAIKTTDFTAVSNEGYFVNTSGGSDITAPPPPPPAITIYETVFEPPGLPAQDTQNVPGLVKV